MAGKLGQMQVNWRNLTMQFKVEGKTVLLQGDSSLFKSQVSLKTLMKPFKEEGQGVLFELGSMGVQCDETLLAPPGILRNVLMIYQAVFQWPGELPPCRARDHSIVL